jgi:hypothetical protein
LLVYSRRSLRRNRFKLGQKILRMLGAPTRRKIYTVSRPGTRTRKPHTFRNGWDDEMRMLSHAAPDGTKLLMVLMGYGKLPIFDCVNDFRMRMQSESSRFRACQSEEAFFSERDHDCE